MATWGVDGGVREGERTRLLAVNVHIPVFPGRTAKPCLRRREVQEFRQRHRRHHLLVADLVIARDLVLLGERAEADGQAWHVPNDVPRITQGELIQLVANEAGVQAKVQTAGKFILLVLGWFTPELKESVEMLYEFEKPFIVDSSKFEHAFGMKATLVGEAVKETVQWYKGHPAKRQ